MFSGFSTCFGKKSKEAASHDLGALLREQTISRVFVVGLAGDYCVSCTAVDAKKEGFEVLVIEEAVRSVDSSMEGWKSVKKRLNEAGVLAVSTEGPELRDVSGLTA